MQRSYNHANVNRLWKITLLLLIGMVGSALLSIAIHKKVLEPALAREQAFDAIAGGHLQADAAGSVDLPAEWRAASVDGKAYVTGSPGHTIWVLFVAEKSKTTRVRGYLYCNKPAEARVSGAVQLNYPTTAGRQIEATVMRILNPNCFEVVNTQDHPPAATEPW
jgi:hypothetical protein